MPQQIVPLIYKMKWRRMGRKITGHGVNEEINEKRVMPIKQLGLLTVIALVMSNIKMR